MDAFLKGDDRVGWSIEGKLPPVDMVLRKGDLGFNNPEAEQKFPRRTEQEWPIARTQYTPYYLTPDQKLETNKPDLQSTSKLSYEALGTMEAPQLVQFSTPPIEVETEITGHVVAHLNVSVSAKIGGTLPTDIDLFVTIRHISPAGKEVHYTGTAGDPVPLCKGWLRVSMRKVDTEHHRHRSYLPYRDYFSTSKLPVLPGEIYPVDVEIWPTNVVLEKGAKLIFEVSSGDTQGSGIFQHKDPSDRYVQSKPDPFQLKYTNTSQFGGEVGREEQHPLWSKVSELCYLTYRTRKIETCRYTNTCRQELPLAVAYQKWQTRKSHG